MGQSTVHTMMKFLGLIFVLMSTATAQQGVCQFREETENGMKSIRLSENTRVGTEVLILNAYPRRNFNIQALDGSRELSGFFSFRELDRKRVGIVLQKSLQDLVDQSAPISSIQFRLACRGVSGDTDYLPVTVYVEDENDNAPEFIGGPYNITVDELTPPGLTIFRGIQALDRDKPNTANSEIVYSIVSGNLDRKFSIEATSKKAVLVLRKPLDYDSGERVFNITIKAQDKGSPSLSSSTYVLIYVRDGDDLSPLFTKDVYEVSIQEDFPIKGNPINKALVMDSPIKAVDQDLSLNASIEYTITNGNEGDIFSIDESTGQLYQVKELDYEATDSSRFNLEIQATQKDNPLKTALAKVIINLEDINDNLAEFESDNLNLTLAEHLENGFEVLKMNATDRDKGTNGKFFYILEDPSGAFEIDARSGQVRVKNSALFDREKFEILQMKVSSQQMNKIVGAEVSSNNSVNIVINIEDINDNSPVFVPSNTYVFSLPVSKIRRGQVVGSVEARDSDQELNAQVRYRIKNDTEEANIFSVDANSGTIRIKTDETLKQKRYILYVSAVDQSLLVEDRRTSMAIVEVRIQGSIEDRPKREPEKLPQEILGTAGGEENQLKASGSEDVSAEAKRKERLAASAAEEPTTSPRSRAPPNTLGPFFQSRMEEFNVQKNARPGTPIGRPKVEALSSDGSQVRWSMMHRYRRGVPFNIHMRSGLISVAREIEKNELSTYTVKVFVESEGKNASTKVRIHILDPESTSPDSPSDSSIDQNRPDESGQDDQTGEVVGDEVGDESSRSDNFAFSIKENVAGALVANLTILAFQRKDPNFLEYVITNEEAKEKFSITDTGLLHTKVALDRESKDSYDVVIAMGKRGVIRGKEVLRVKVAVDDENDNSPVFDRHIYQGTIRRTATTGSEVTLGSNLHVTDLDLNDTVQLKLLGKGSGLFRLERASGRVFLNGTLNLEANDEKFYLRLRATDKAGHITESQLVIHVLKEQDTPPIVRGLAVIDGNFVTLGPDGSIMIKENAPVGTRIAKLVVTDQRSSKVEKDLIFSILSEKVETVPELSRHKHPKRQIISRDLNEKHFSIEENSGDLVILRRLALTERYLLNISVLDSAGFKADTLILASVEDVNDHSPVFSKDVYEFRIPEGSYGRTKLGEILASDGDLGSNAEITYYLETNVSEKYPMINLDSKDGSIFVRGELDRELEPEFTFTVIARDGASQGSEDLATEDTGFNESRANVTVLVLDANDNSPNFYGYTRLRRKEGSDLNDPHAVMPIYTSEIDESFPVETEFLRVFANDSDVGLNGLVTYELLNHKNKFRLDNFSGSLTTISHLNFNEANEYDLSIVAVDRGRPSLRAMAAVVIQVKKSIPVEVSTTTTTITTTTTTTTTTTENSSQNETEQEEEESAVGPTGVARPFIDDDVEKVEAEPKQIVLKTPRKLFTQSSVTIDVFENLRVPENLLDLRSLLIDQNQNNILFDFAPSDVDGIFKIDQKSGYLMLIESPDREQRINYVIRVRCVERAEIAEREVPVFFYTLYVQDAEHQVLAEDELEVVLNIKDVNDNHPEFLTFENPVQVSVSSQLQSGDIIAKMEAWDADEGVNALINYHLNHLVPTDETDEIFAMNLETGDVALKTSLLNLAGKTFQMEAIAVDRAGDVDGLASKLDLIVFVLSPEYQLKVVLSNEESQVVKEEQNITRILSDLTGYSIRAHQIEEHRRGVGLSSSDINGSNPGRATDVYVFATDSNGLVNTDTLLRKLSSQLPEAKSRLARHGLIEIQTGSSVSQWADPSLAHDGANSPEPVMGSVEIAILGMALAVFFGALVAVVSIFCIRAKRQSKTEASNYPAPLAIPLPSYSVEPQGGGVGGPTTIVHHNHPALHHGDILRHSGKGNKNSKSSNLFNNNHIFSFHKSLDTSEETSDTCIDENHDNQSSGPSSGGGVDFFQRRPMGHSSRRSRGKYSSPSKSPAKRRANMSSQPNGPESIEPNRSRDSGIAERRESSLSCSCHHSSGNSCDTCSDGSDHEPCLNHQQPAKGNTVHFSCSHHSSKSSSFRRHKSASPSRSFHNNYHASLPSKTHAAYHVQQQQQQQQQQVCQCHSPVYLNHNNRSKSTGQLPGEEDVGQQQLCSCSNCQSRSRSRSKSSGGPDLSSRSSCNCCENGGDLCRHAKASQSTRSTRWEVYQHIVGTATGRQGALYQSELTHPNRESSPIGLRTAFSTANKALSWRGDHPMKNEHFFQANAINELAQEEKGQGRTYTTRLAQKQGNRNTGGSNYKLIHHGIKLVGLSPTSPSQKTPKN